MLEGWFLRRMFITVYRPVADGRDKDSVGGRLFVTLTTVHAPRGKRSLTDSRLRNHRRSTISFISGNPGFQVFHRDGKRFRIFGVKLIVDVAEQNLFYCIVTTGNLPSICHCLLDTFIQLTMFL